MSYVLTDGSNNIITYPYSIGLLRKDNLNVSFPSSPTDAQLAEWNVFPVQDTDYPSYNLITESVITANPIYNNGWLQTWEIIQNPQEEIDSRINSYTSSLRLQRNELLASSDWTQFIDSPLSTEKKAEWIIYRQQLRDLPNTTVDITNPIWPTKPL